MPERAFKVILCGGPGVGKTSLIFWLLNRRFVEGFHPTIGPSVVEFPVTVHDRQYELKLWDTAGQERYRSLAPSYFRDATAAIIVFGATDANPVPTVTEWVTQFRSAVANPALVFVAANKIDLVEDMQPIAMIGELLKAALDVDFFVVSAKIGTGILALFQEVAEMAVLTEVEPIEVFLHPASEKAGCC
jgi:Ras-related protein Rab-6A